MAERMDEVNGREPAGPGHRAWVHVRHGDRQNQHHRAEPAHFDRMVRRLRRGVHAHDDDAVRHRLPGGEGHRDLGHQHPHWLGLRHRQFRLVDRHRARGNADLRHSAVAAAIVAEFDQPVCRSHDAVCGGGCRNFSADPHRAPVACVLAVSVSQHDELLAAIPQPAALGCVRGLDLLHDLAAVLVRGTDS